MLRKILALLVGIIVANVIITLMHLVNGLIYGMPKIESGDSAAIATYVASLPTLALLVVAFGYALGYFVAGFAMRKVSRWHSSVLPVVLGVLGTLGWVLNLMNIPHPIWMTLLGFFCFIPFALVGHYIAGSD